LLTFFRKLFK